MRCVWFLLVGAVVADLRRPPLRSGLVTRGGGGGGGGVVSVPRVVPAAGVGGAVHHGMTPLELGCCIVADLCPHGMLPLAWAAAKGGGTGTAPTLLVLVAFAAASSYTLYVSARLAEADARRPSSVALSSLWSGAGLPGARGVDAAVAVLCGGCCVFYATFAADLFHALLASCAPNVHVSRAAVVAALTAAPLAPLCLSDDLSVLKYSSYAGLAGVLYTALFFVRAGATTTAASAATALKVPVWRFSSGSAVLANTLVVAFLCHYNALQYYQELHPAQRSPRKYGLVAASAFGVTACVFACTLFGGRAAFGATALPNVLKNLDASVPAHLAKLGTGVAILSGFPLMFAGLKAALDGAVPALKRGPKRRTNLVHTALLALFAVCAAVATDDDIGLVIELLGSTLGCAAVYVVPGVAAARAPSFSSTERRVGAAVAAAGTLLACFGTFITVTTHTGH